MLSFSKDYFNEEYREGYLVSEIMKRSWASQMQLLDALKRLLEKYGLKYYAECGTLLGAVRHKGYIPWDDDLDISMPRKDYMELLKHAEEIDDDLCIRSIYNSNSFMSFHAVITHKADKLEWDVNRINRFHGCPFICFIDIFPWDFVFSGMEEFKKQKSLYTKAYKLVHECAAIEEELFAGRLITLKDVRDTVRTNKNGNDRVKRFLVDLSDVLGQAKTCLSNHSDINEEAMLRKQLCIITDRIAQMCPESELLDYAPNLASPYNHPRKAIWSNEVIEMAFENTSIVVPKGYKDVLNNQYGSDYMQPARYASAHGYPFFRDEIRVLCGGETGDNYFETEIEPSVDDVPEQIRDFLITADGKLKKIIIYGLSATDIVNNGTMAIKKIRNYLLGFDNKEDQIVICFAPKGLKRFMSRCSLELLKEYEKLMDDIEKMNNIIFDNEPSSREIGAFLALCDEYIGDECPLADWCRKYNIPVTIQEYQPVEYRFHENFFKEEVRDGFYISEMMKRFWAAQLILFGEIQKICRRHSLKYHVDMGTLLGAIRHKGYIPWDDDFDISMLRDDWEKFFEYAKTELPEGYIALTAVSNKEYDLSLGRVVNSQAIDINESHLKEFCGCPYVIGVDIFPIDKIYADPDKENDRRKRAKDVYTAAELLNKKGISDSEVKSLLASIERANHIVFHRDSRISRELVLLNEKISSECRDEDAKEAAFMFPWVMQNRMNCDIELFQDIVWVPFENISVPVPRRYDELLTKEYGDYMTVHKGGGVHEYPVYREQEDMLKSHLGHNPFRYTLTKEEYEKALEMAGDREHLSMAEQVIYTPDPGIDDPIDDNDKAIVALKPYIEKPEVVYADRVVVKTPRMRQLYIDTLTGIIGEESRDFWAKKICLADNEA